MSTCLYCGIDFTGMNRGQSGNHRRWCYKNPKLEEHRKTNRDTILQNHKTKFGDNKTYSHACDSCGNVFDVVERELLHPQKEKYFCSRKCANSVGGTANALKYHYDEVATYVTVGFRHHKKKCCVCDEYRIVEIHHVDCNHENNDPKNLVPLCSTHHRYMHSRYKSLIEDKVKEYISNKWA